MITVRELFSVTPTITMVEFTVRSTDLRLRHRFWYGRDCNREHLPRGLVTEWLHNEITLSDAKINEHNEPKANGQPELGWGLKDGVIPDELLDAEIFSLSMRCTDGIEYTVVVDVFLPELTVEVLKHGTNRQD